MRVILISMLQWLLPVLPLKLIVVLILQENRTVMPTPTDNQDKLPMHLNTAFTSFFTLSFFQDSSFSSAWEPYCNLLDFSNVSFLVFLNWINKKGPDWQTMFLIKEASTDTCRVNQRPLFSFNSRTNTHPRKVNGW